MPKREGKPADFKPADSKFCDAKTSAVPGRAHSSSETPASGDAPVQTAPAVVAQPVPWRAPAVNAEITNPTFDPGGTFDTPAATTTLSDAGATTPAAEAGSTTNRREVSATETNAPDSKSANLAAGDAPVGGNTLSRAPASTSDFQARAASPVAAQSTPAPVLDWKMAVENLTPNVLVTGGDQQHANVSDHLKSASATAADSPAKPGAIGESTSPQGLLRDVAPTEHSSQHSSQQQGGPSRQESASAKLATPDTRPAEAVTRLVASLLGPPSFDTKTQPVSVPGPVRDIPRASAAADDNPTPAAAKSEGDPLLAPLSALSPALVVPMHTLGSANSGNSDTQGTSVNPTWDKSKISVTQASATPDLAATTRKNVEAAAGAKAQPHKDDSPASTNSQASDQTKASAPAKAIEAAPSLVAAGSQPSSAGMTADNKNSGAGSPPRGNDQLANQFDRAHVQTPAETQAVYPTSLINSAKLVERIGESELRLGIRAGEFGSVDIRTSMVRNQFTAQISVERGELGRVMAAELPSLQNRLTEQRVAVANITVQNHAGSHSTASEQQKPRDGQAAYATNPVNRRDEGPVPVLVAMEGSAPSSRLDIHM